MHRRIQDYTLVDAIPLAYLGIGPAVCPGNVGNLVRVSQYVYLGGPFMARGNEFDLVMGVIMLVLIAFVAVLENPDVRRYRRGLQVRHALRVRRQAERERGER